VLPLGSVLMPAGLRAAGPVGRLVLRAAGECRWTSWSAASKLLALPAGEQASPTSPSATRSTSGRASGGPPSR
jgi:hypothetical protein